MHIPVLLQETLEGLDIREGETVLDATVDGGGMSSEICKRFKSVRLIGLDLDESALAEAKARLKDCNAELFLENFRNMDKVLDGLGISFVDKVVFDLGVNSDQFDSSGRGFSFSKNEPLLMTLSTHPGKEELTAIELVNSWNEEEIEEILREYSDEKFSKEIARGIVSARKKKMLETTSELVDVVLASTPTSYQKRKIHPATKTFQAIRMAVNDEPGAIKEGLSKAFEHLSVGGRLAVISFHSVEDRIVKLFAKELDGSGKGRRINKKPITPSFKEIKTNPRSRSAKLRVIEKV